MTHSDYLAVFDWNGTLFNDTHATHEATNACLEFFGKAPITLEEEQETFTFPLIHFYEKMGVDADTYLKYAHEAADVFVDVYERENSKCTLADGALEILDWLTGCGVTCMILSNHLEDKLLADVDRLGLTSYMTCISGNKDRATVARGLSKQRRLETHMSENGFSPEKTFIIGDSHEEPDLARHLDIMGISLSGGLLSPARLEKYKKDHVIHSLYDLKPILMKEWNLTAKNAPAYARKQP